MNDIDAEQFNVNNGPVARQLMMYKFEEEFNKGNIQNSIYYQVGALYGIVQDRYFNKLNDSNKHNKVSESYQQSEKQDETKCADDILQNNKLIQYIRKSLENNVKNEKDDFVKEFVDSCNFLQNIRDPKMGYKKILEICKEFPKEWTIVQVCKAARPQTTYSVFREIHEREADIYVTILKHARSAEYPDPICLRFSDITQISMFEKFANIADQCKEYMLVVTTHEDKVKYWENLKILDKNVRDVIDELHAYIFPWTFLFRGIPATSSNAAKQQKSTFAKVDQLCEKFSLKIRERILLSLAALQSAHLTYLEIEAISEELSEQQEIQIAIQTLLQKLQSNLATLRKSPNTKNDKKSVTYYKHTSFPCILVVDEQLDHFYWEELNAKQELCRVNSLHCLLKLYKANQHRIKSGYLQVNLKNGACVINPDATLPKTQMRMGAFFKYWTPSWAMKLGEKATQEELLNDFLKRDCYVYAGHGSGLQHISGRRISQQNISAVVFLFGCDSTRMSSNGLFSDLIGSHFYYHAAMCPCIVGTILPALDANMDEISVEIVSRCVVPETKQIAMWHEINNKLWTKEGIIERLAVDKEKPSNESIENHAYQMPSLCGVVCTIRARGEEKKYYNTVPYVCRGLPAWNCDLQPLPPAISSD